MQAIQIKIREDADKLDDMLTRIDFEALGKALSGSKRLIVYGTDYFSVITVFELSLFGIPIDFFVARKVSEPTFFGRPAYRIGDVPQAWQSDAVVLIVADCKYYNQIVKRFKAKGYTEFVNIKSFQLINRQRGRHLESQRLRRIAMAVASQMPNGGAAVNAIFQDMFNKLHEPPEKKAVAVVSNASPRVYKIIRAIKAHGIRVECAILNTAVDTPGMKQIIAEAADRSFVINSWLELLVTLILSKASFVHMFSCVFSFINMSMLSYMIYNKDILPTIVFEQYDIGKLYDTISEPILGLEKFCIENADVVCDRAFEVDYLTEQEGYVLKGPLVKLWDGCTDEVQAPPMIKRSKDRPLSLCYAGDLPQLKKKNDWDWFELAELCEKNKCHVHVYPHPGVWNLMKDERFRERLYWEHKEYFDMDRQYEYFHLHEPVPFTELIKELSQYDYGIVPVRTVNYFYDDTDFWPPHSTGKYKGIYCPTNKIFDYINAGIPILSVNPERVTEFLERKGIAIRANVEDFDFDMLKEKRDLYRERVEAVKNDFLMNKLIEDLLKLIMPAQSGA